MNDYYCFSVNKKAIHHITKDNNVHEFVEFVKDKHCVGVFVDLDNYIFVFSHRKDKNEVMIKAKNLGIKTVKNAYLNDEQIKKIKDYYSNIN